MDKKELARYLDLANHHPNSTPEDVKALCQKAIDYGFYSVFVNPFFVDLAKRTLTEMTAGFDLSESWIPVVGTVVSFPIGQDCLKSKINSALESLRTGADELDVSTNVGLLKAGLSKAYLDELRSITQAAKSTDSKVVVKFIIETGYLTAEEIKRSAELVLESGADFVKTCSGLGPRGATLADVHLIRQAVGSRIRIKVAGGVTNQKEAIAFIGVGADRIGTSHAVEIVTGATAIRSSENKE